MELLRVSPAGSKLWEQVWRLYTDSFPVYERRRISSHSRACEDGQFNTCIAIDNGNLLALLFYWKYDNYIYIEHIAVLPELRGKNIGSELLTEFIRLNQGKKLILEIDPPIDDISKRRLSFYEKVGFLDTGYSYIHPSFTKSGGQEHELHILSYPEVITEEEFGQFKQYMKDRVLTYID